jgi:hypothetical protein
MKKCIFAVVLLVFMAGCEGDYMDRNSSNYDPQLDSIATAHVGDDMPQQGKFPEQDAIYIRENVKTGMLGGYTFTRGYYLKKGQDNKYEFYLPFDGADSGQVIVEALYDPFKIIRLDKKSGKLCGISIYNLAVCTNKANYEKKKYRAVSSDSVENNDVFAKLEKMRNRRIELTDRMEQVSEQEAIFIKTLNDQQLASYEAAVQVFKSNEQSSQEVARRDLQANCDPNTYNLAMEILHTKGQIKRDADLLSADLATSIKDGEESSRRAEEKIQHYIDHNP